MTVGILVLAAGEGRRMGEGAPYKLLCSFAGIPLVRRVCTEAIESAIGPVVVVTGFRAQDVEAALAGLPLEFVVNPRHADGMASSLQVGLTHPALQAVDGLIVMLADMPTVGAMALRQLRDQFLVHNGHAVIRAADGDRPGNPVVLPKSLFAPIMSLAGDEGARRVIAAGGLPVHLVDIGPAALQDVDTPEALVAAGGELREITHG
ncbi:NTP transferase domain-containing protein [Rhizobium sp. NRK18]|uniref:nucleotidyltransferase family protein n=1 Tax=Rhizobium sp. NRK18 TaxID=2964667 RepID=UPI0021C47BF7|nr:nucleotidyltransferase family protein [Rhizobium sp. NRK18]MCQ2004080.1 nucleotidyltransferase family protein [Rhizobium sp. NRK18]